MHDKVLSPSILAVSGYYGHHVVDAREVTAQGLSFAAAERSHADGVASLRFWPELPKPFSTNAMRFTLAVGSRSGSRWLLFW
jgi:hypothetical protein